MISLSKNIFRSLYAIKTACIITLCCVAFPRALNSQTNTTEEYQLKAVFLYNFSRFVEWPKSAYTSSNSPFVIGILGGDPFGKFLDEAIKGETIDNHVMSIHHYQAIDEIDNCQILFINYKEADKIKKVLKSIEGKNILTVNESSDFARLGGMIQLFTELNKIKLMINNEAIKATDLQISSKLLGVARIY